MASEKNNILELSQYTKSDKIPYIIYADIEPLIKKQMNVQTIQKIQTTKIGQHIPCGYFMSSIQALDHIEYKHTLYCGKNCMKVLQFLKGACEKHN